MAIPNIWLLESWTKLGMTSIWGWPHHLHWKSIFLTNSFLEPFMTENLPVLNLISKVYNTFLPQLRNGEQSNFEVWKKCVNYNDLCRKSHFFQTILLDLELWQLIISKPVELYTSKESPTTHQSQCLKTQKEDKKIADGWSVDFLYYYDIFEWSKV